MNKSESIKELATALNKFQAECSGAKKNAENPHFKSKFANLEAVINCAKDALSDNGLSVSQFPVMDQGYAGVETILMHISGEWISNTLLLACKKQDPQAMGSAITYARRYAYQSVLGIPSEDDDGNKSMPNQEAQHAPQKITHAQAQELLTICQSKPAQAVKACLDHFKAKSTADVIAVNYQVVKDSLMGLQ
jgi:hypothetical protein